MSNTHEITDSIVKAASERLASGDANEAHVFEYQGKEFVIKERHGRRDEFPEGYSLSETAYYFNKALSIAKKYYGEKLASTLYFIAQNARGEAALFTLQPYVEGEPGVDARTESMLNLKWGQRVMNDPAWDLVPDDVYNYFAKSDLWGQNLRTLRDGSVKIIDF